MTRKLLAALLAGCMIITLLAGCSKREEEIPEEETEPAQSESQSARPVPSGPLTEEQAADINAQISDDDVNLVQFVGIGSGDTVANIYTTSGLIRIKLFPEQAPKAVENFISLVGEGYYNGITFHKVVGDLLIQTGDPEGTGNGGQSAFSSGEGDPGYFDDEFSLDLWHFRGAVAMAHIGEQAGTNASQFYIVQRDYVTEKTVEGMRSIHFPDKVIDKYEEVGGAPHLDWEYTVFGMVADKDSMEVVDKIASVRTDGDEPVDPILIENISIETK